MILKSVNGVDVSTKNYYEVAQHMSPLLAKLPLEERLQNGIEIIFESEGREHAITFRQKPLGMAFQPQLPLIVHSLSDAAKELGILRGWKVKSIQGLVIT